MPARGALSISGERLSFEIFGAIARKTAGAMSRVSIKHEAVTPDGLQIFEYDTMSSYPYNQLQPCLLKEGEVLLSQNVSGAPVE